MRRLPIEARRILTATAAAVVLLSAAGRARANPDVYERTLRATVWVVSPMEGSRASMGTGVLVDRERRLLLTNYHVVGDRDEVVVFFPAHEAGEVIADPAHYVKNRNRLGIAGRVLATQPRSDLAVVELKAVPEGAQALSLAAKKPRPGETVHAIGNSGVSDGVLWRYRRGEVRQVARKTFKCGNDQGLTLEVSALVVEVQSPTSCGDSGGPVVNGKGELVAITQSADREQQALDHSIHVSEVQALLADLDNLKKKEVSKRPPPAKRGEDEKDRTGTAPASR